MRIHSDTLTRGDILAANYQATDISGAPVYLTAITWHGSRQRRHGIEISLSSDGTLTRRRSNTGTGGAGEHYAATFDQWGYVIARLFEADPNAVVGPYRGRDDFHRQTANRFATQD